MLESLKDSYEFIKFCRKSGELSQIKQWCQTKNVFYLKADILIPEEAIAEAKEIYNKGLFVPHREGDGRGWQSCSLYGEDWNITTYDKDKKDSYDWTMLTKYAPIMTKWLKETFPNSGKYTRCRFMLLEPGGYIKPHTDTHKFKSGMKLKNDIRSAINIAITQPENCYLRRVEDALEVPFKPREVYWFNNGPFHEAANFSKEPRIHFIIHGGECEERTDLFIKSFHKQFPNAKL